MFSANGKAELSFHEWKIISFSNEANHRKARRKSELEKKERIFVIYRRNATKMLFHCVLKIVQSWELLSSIEFVHIKRWCGSHRPNASTITQTTLIETTKKGKRKKVPKIFHTQNSVCFTTKNIKSKKRCTEDRSEQCEYFVFRFMLFLC